MSKRPKGSDIVFQSFFIESPHYSIQYFFFNNFLFSYFRNCETASVVSGLTQIYDLYVSDEDDL